MAGPTTPKAGGYYPPVGFHFKVEVSGISGDNDSRFMEVSGLSVETATEEVPEGGENRFVQKYPGRAKYPELVLKRGFLVQSGLAEWAMRCIRDLDITPRDLDIKLLNEEQEPLVTWHVTKAFPTKWSVSDLNASNNAIVVETMQLYYQEFRVDRG